jgi:hypothetical protein
VIASALRAAPWLKGDPQTDMTQAEVGVRPETQIVHEGRQALAFMVRVDWTEKPGEKYPKGRVIGFGAFPADKSNEDWEFPQGLVVCQP